MYVLDLTYRLHDYESTVTNDLAGEVQLSGINFPNPYAKKISQSPLSNINSRSYLNVPH